MFTIPCLPTSLLLVLSNLCLVCLQPRLSIHIRHIIPVDVSICYSVKFWKRRPEDMKFESGFGTQLTVSGHCTGLLCPLISDSGPAVITVTHCTFTKGSSQFTCCFSHPKCLDFIEGTHGEVGRGWCGWKCVTFSPDDWAKIIKVNLSLWGQGPPVYTINMC